MKNEVQLEDVKWITVNGNHIPIKEGQSINEAINSFFNNKKEKPKREPRKMQIVYIAGKAQLFDKAEADEYTLARKGDEVNIDEDELNEVSNSVIGDINNYSYDKPTDYTELRNKINQKLLDLGLDNEILRTEFISNYIVNSFNKIREHKAETFLKTMPKLENVDAKTILRGCNQDNRAWSYQFYDSDVEKFDMYTSNCQRCVAAWYLRHLGYDVEAMPYIGKWDQKTHSFPTGSPNDILYRQNRSNWALAMFCRNTLTASFMGKPKQWASSQLKEITNIAKKDGSGACYVLTLDWRGSSDSHVIIVHNDNGNVKFIDPQTGKSNQERVFSKLNLITNNTQLIRIDKAKLNGEVINQIVTKDKANPGYKRKEFLESFGRRHPELSKEQLEQEADNYMDWEF